MGLQVPLLVQLQLQAQFFPKWPLGQTARVSKKTLSGLVLKNDEKIFMIIRHFKLYFIYLNMEKSDGLI